MEISSAQVCEELLSCFKRFKQAMVQLAETHGLTSMQLFALHAVQHGATTMGQIAAVLQCDASNVTGIIDRLVTQQLIKRQESPQDRRAKILQLTTKGSKIIAMIDQQMPAQLGCDKLGVVDRTRLHEIIAKIA
jgi:DNA-binding MarR family transcriptional regulator